ncbi:hypothetical protein JHK82_054935 [Glycine max]|nr:hypothetical protein JHK82_054935 [Glycine max]
MESSAACPLHEILEMVRPLSDPYGSASVGTVVLELLSAFDGEGRNDDVIKSVLPIAESNGFQLAKHFSEWQCRDLPVFEGCKYHSYASSPIPGLSSLNTY